MRRYLKTKVYKWDENIAYIAGLIASDGCLYNDYRHINLTSSETVLLESFKSILNLNASIKSKPNGFGGMGYYLQFSDVSLYDFLYESGIKPAKSKTIRAVDIPDIFYGDFLRGYFDGDGTIYGFWDKRWRTSLMYYAEFCSASHEFLNWLHLQNQRLALVSGGRINPGVRAFALSYAKTDSRKLFKLMYAKPDCPALKRKRDKFIAFLELDPYASKKIARVPESVDGSA